MTKEQEAILWAGLYLEERRKNNPNALNRANARLVLAKMNEAASK